MLRERALIHALERTHCPVTSGDNPPVCTKLRIAAAFPDGPEAAHSDAWQRTAEGGNSCQADGFSTAVMPADVAAHPGRIHRLLVFGCRGFGIGQRLRREGFVKGLRKKTQPEKGPRTLRPALAAWLRSTRAGPWRRRERRHAPVRNRRTGPMNSP